MFVSTHGYGPKNPRRPLSGENGAFFPGSGAPGGFDAGAVDALAAEAGVAPHTAAGGAADRRCPVASPMGLPGSMAGHGGGGAATAAPLASADAATPGPSFRSSRSSGGGGGGAAAGSEETLAASSRYPPPPPLTPVAKRAASDEPGFPPVGQEAGDEAMAPAAAAPAAAAGGGAARGGAVTLSGAPARTSLAASRVPEPLFESRLGQPQIVNVGLARAATGGSAASAWRRILTADVLPRLAAFRPDLILVSAGFDAHHKAGGEEVEGGEGRGWASTRTTRQEGRQRGKERGGKPRSSTLFPGRTQPESGHADGISAAGQASGYHATESPARRPLRRTPSTGASLASARTTTSGSRGSSSRWPMRRRVGASSPYSRAATASTAASSARSGAV